MSAEASKRDKLEAVLTKFVGIGDLEGVAVVSTDGLPVVSRLPKEVDTGIYSAMSAAMYAAGDTVLRELKRGECKMITAESDQKIILAQTLDTKRILVALFSSKTNLGLIRAEMTKTADDLRKLL